LDARFPNSAYIADIIRLFFESGLLNAFALYLSIKLQCWQPPADKKRGEPQVHMLFLLLSLMTTQAALAAGNPCEVQPAGLYGLIQYQNKIYKKKTYLITGRPGIQGLFLNNALSINTPTYCCSGSTVTSCSAIASDSTTPSRNSAKVARPTCWNDKNEIFKDYDYQDLSSIQASAFAWVEKNDPSHISACCAAEGKSAAPSDCRVALQIKNNTYSLSGGSQGSRTNTADDFSRRVAELENKKIRELQDKEDARVRNAANQARQDAAKERANKESKLRSNLDKAKAEGKTALEWEDRAVDQAKDAWRSASKENQSDAAENYRDAKEERSKIRQSAKNDSRAIRAELKANRERQKGIESAGSYDSTKECGNYRGTSCRGTDNINAISDTTTGLAENIIRMDVENKNAMKQSEVTQKGLTATPEDALRAQAAAAWNAANGAQNAAIMHGAAAVIKGARGAEHGVSGRDGGRVQNAYEAAAEQEEALAAASQDEAQRQMHLDAAEKHRIQGAAELKAQKQKAGDQVVATSNSLASMASKIFESIQGKNAQEQLNKIADDLPKNQGTGFTFWNPNSTDTSTDDQMQVTDVPTTGVTSDLPISDIVAPENLYDPEQLVQGAPEGEAAPYNAAAGAAPVGAGLSGLAGGGGGTSAAQSEDKPGESVRNGSAGKYAAGEGGPKPRGSLANAGGGKVGADGMLKSLQDLMDKALADKKEEVAKGYDASQRDIAAEGSYVHGRDADIFQKVTESYQRHAPELPST
jgi:hypothetical protein